MPDYVPGLEGVVAAQTEISLVDGANGRLVYRGYVIADLAEEMSFEEVAHLFWFGHLPNRPELDGLAAELSGSRSLTQAAAAALDALPTDADPMDVLRSVVSVQGVRHRLEKPNIPAAIHVTASFPTILAAFHRRRPRRQLPIYAHRNRSGPGPGARPEHLPGAACRPRHERLNLHRARDRVHGLGPRILSGRSHRRPERTGPRRGSIRGDGPAGADRLRRKRRALDA